MDRIKKILIGMIIIAVLVITILFAGEYIGREGIIKNEYLEGKYIGENFEVEYKECLEGIITLFNMSAEYKQYLKEGEVNEEIKKVFEYNKIPLHDEARMSKLPAEGIWEIEYKLREIKLEDTGEHLKAWTYVYDNNHIKNIEWNDDVLIVDAIVNGVVCDIGINKFTFDHKVEEDWINLFISERNILGSRCAGAYDFRFKIKNLEKKDYSISLYKRNYYADEKVFFLVDEGIINNTK